MVIAKYEDDSEDLAKSAIVDNSCNLFVVCSERCFELHPVGIALGLLPGHSHNQKQNTLTNACSDQRSQNRFGQFNSNHNLYTISQTNLILGSCTYTISQTNLIRVHASEWIATICFKLNGRWSDETIEIILWFCEWQECWCWLVLACLEYKCLPHHRT